jgi:hypothetical protein
MEIETIKLLTKVESNIKGTSLITIYLPAGSNI